MVAIRFGRRLEMATVIPQWRDRYMAVPFFDIAHRRARGIVICSAIAGRDKRILGTLSGK